MTHLIELNELLLDVIDQYMEATDPDEIALLDVLTDACMEVEEFLEKRNRNGNDRIQH